MKQGLVLIAFLGIAGFFGSRELSYQLDLYSVSQDIEQLQVSQFTNRYDVSAAGVIDLVKTKAADHHFQVQQIEVTRSPQISKSGGPPAANTTAFHDYALHATLTRELVLGRLQEAPLNESWRAACPNKPSGDESSEPEELVVEPERG